jgi:hypothetical protein
MPVTVKGDFGALDAWIKRLENAPKALEGMSSNMAEEALGLIAEGFKTGTDPYGEPWNAPNNLQITGGIRRFTKVFRRSGFMLSATDGKAIWHHQPKKRAAWGGKALPTRLMIPTTARGIPPRWRKRLVDAGEAELKSHFGGGSKAAGMGLVTARVAGFKRRFNWRSLLNKAVKTIGGD